MHTWLHVQLDQKILDGLYYVTSSKLSSVLIRVSKENSITHAIIIMASSKDPIMSINQKLASINILSNFLITDNTGDPKIVRSL